MRFKGRVVFFLLCGAAALTVGLTRSETVSLDCGGETMRPGAVCDEWGNGRSESYTYDEWIADQEQNQRTITLIWLVAGGVLIALAPISYALGARHAHRTANVGARKALAEARGWQYLPDKPPGSADDPYTEHPHKLIGTVDGTAVQVWDKTTVPQSIEHKTHIAVALPRPAKPLVARRWNIKQPPELGRAISTPEMVALFKKTDIDHWSITGTHLIVTADRINDRQTDEKLVPLIDATVRLARALPSAVFVTA